MLYSEFDCTCAHRCTEFCDIILQEAGAAGLTSHGARLEDGIERWRYIFAKRNINNLTPYRAGASPLLFMRSQASHSDSWPAGVKKDKAMHGMTMGSAELYETMAGCTWTRTSTLIGTRDPTSLCLGCRC